MNLKCPIPVHKKHLEMFVGYVRDSGWKITETDSGYGTVFWAYDCPWFGKLTPVAETQTCTEPKKHWIYIRIPEKEEP